MVFHELEGNSYQSWRFVYYFNSISESETHLCVFLPAQR